jgi:hypothetical protein
MDYIEGSTIMVCSKKECLALSAPCMYRSTGLSTLSRECARLLLALRNMVVNKYLFSVVGFESRFTIRPLPHVPRPKELDGVPSKDVM